MYPTPPSPVSPTGDGGFAQRVMHFRQSVLGPDPMAVMAQLAPLTQHAAAVGAQQLTPAVAHLAPAVAAAPVPLCAALAAVAAGAMVEHGGDPGPLTRIVLDRLGSALSGTHSFIDAWLEHCGGPFPERDQAAIAMAATSLNGRLGPQRAAPLVAAWRDAPHWAVAAVACLHHASARGQLGDRGAWTTQVDPLHSIAPQFMPLILALRILDENILVLHRPTRRGAMVWISGIADNFQLQVLLADALTESGVIDGQRPDQRWVSVMSDGPDGTRTEHVDDFFHLADSTGATVRNEAGPADIATVAQTRVLVLDDARYSRHWRPGRRFPIPARAKVQRVLTDDEVGAWLGFVQPAAE